MAAIAGGSMPEVDLFTLPHRKMRQLIITSTEKVLSTDFTDTVSVEKLLNQLSSALLDFRNHEEIEDKCIMRSLRRRLSGAMLRKLVKHLHSDNHISDMIDFINTIQEKIKRVKSSEDLNVDGKELHDVFETFANDYLPHMMHEEQVFQPLMKQHFTPIELENIKEKVLDLHAIHCSKDLFREYGKKADDISEKEKEKSSVKESTNEVAQNVVLPWEVLLKIFEYLQPKQLCSCAQVCKSWSTVAVDGSLWKIMHPTRWARGNWTFGSRTNSDDCNCDCEPNYDIMAFRDSPVEGSEDGSTSESDSYDHHEEDLRYIKKETKILVGITRHLLPNVGATIKTLVLECSKAITNGLLYRMLSRCPNLEYLDISQTIITDLGLKGLFKDGGGRYLQHLDVSGCVGITDKTLAKLSSALGKIHKEENKDISSASNCKCLISILCSDLNCKCVLPERTSSINSGNSQSDLNSSINTGNSQSDLNSSINTGNSKNDLNSSVITGNSQLDLTRKLRCLRVSGCFKITDKGLGFLARHGGLPYLKHLDLSGCSNITADGIREIVSASPSLDHSELYYCDNILDATPFSDTASGCQNVDCKNRFCCRTGH